MIERKRADAQLGGGQKRIDAQHKKVGNSACQIRVYLKGHSLT